MSAGQSPAGYRAGLEQLFHAAIAAALPGPAVRRALSRESKGSSPHVLAVGKAAAPMARAALAVLAERDLAPAAGLVVCPVAESIPEFAVVTGNHPTPGDGSVRAATAIEDFCLHVPEDGIVWILLSGGSTSLIGGPDRGLTLADLQQSFETLLRSGLDIGTMNRVRKRLTRWGGGKLAVALRQARVLQLVVSDVIGDDLPSIGSGPLVADPIPASRVVALLGANPIGLPPAARQRLEAMARGTWPDIPRPGDPVFDRVRTEIIGSNRVALEAVAADARRMGWLPTIKLEPAEGEASAAGRSLVESLTGLDPAPRPQLLVQGGETTVSLGSAPGLGGRSQELVLAAAQAMHQQGRQDLLVLAGGTDGRDGPTDAAGAIADGMTWAALQASGVDPDRCLADHNSHVALDRISALIRTGPTGTNVMDILLGLRLPAPG